MKAFTEKEQGFILSLKRGHLLRRQELNNFRSSLRGLWLLGVLTTTEKAYIDLEMDKIIYKDVLK